MFGYFGLGVGLVAFASLRLFLTCLYVLSYVHVVQRELVLDQFVDVACFAFACEAVGLGDLVAPDRACL